MSCEKKRGWNKRDMAAPRLIWISEAASRSLHAFCVGHDGQPQAKEPLAVHLCGGIAENVVIMANHKALNQTANISAGLG